MDTNESKTNRKRKHENDDCALERPATPPPLEPIKISDLDDDCLVTSFMHLDEYVNEYCAANLVNISFVNKPNIQIRVFKKPFDLVQKVEMFDCDLGNQMPLFPQWFPNIRALEFNNVYLDQRYIKKPFHHLSELRIDINKNGLRRFKDKEVAALLRMCRQLENLHIRVYDDKGMTFNTLLNFIKDHSNVRNLYVNMLACSMIDKPSQVQRLVREHQALVEIDFTGFKVSVEDAIAMTQQFNSLKWFRFQLDKELEYNNLVARLVGSPWKSSMHTDYWLRHVVTLER